MNRKRRLTNVEFVKRAMGDPGYYYYGNQMFYQEGWIGATDGHRAHFVKIARPPEWSGTINIETGDADPNPKTKIRSIVPDGRGASMFASDHFVRATLSAALAYYKIVKETPAVELAPGVACNARYVLDIIDGLDANDHIFIQVKGESDAIKFTQLDREAILMPMRVEFPVKFSVAQYLVPAEEETI